MTFRLEGVSSKGTTVRRRRGLADEDRHGSCALVFAEATSNICSIERNTAALLLR